MYPYSICFIPDLDSDPDPAFHFQSSRSGTMHKFRIHADPGHIIKYWFFIFVNNKKTLYTGIGTGIQSKRSNNQVPVSAIILFIQQSFSTHSLEFTVDLDSPESKQQEKRAGKVVGHGSGAHDTSWLRQTS